ncbi:MAG: TrwC relaxase, partial [Actinomycetota bacterium]|nr:TrwC relaxase [Actinomycetota bacterium]
MIEARQLAPWLAGYEGNRGYPINRKHYRVLETRADGSLIVTTSTGADGEQYGDRMVLPASYVSQHVALGYASTVQCGQGLNVRAGYQVVTRRTSASALYTGASRGRVCNTMFVVTRSVPEDVPTGTVNQTAHRNPVAVLAEILETDDPARSALAEAVKSATEAGSIRTAAELFTDAAELATAGRTAGWF